ncbi:aspartic and glutamic acid-rich protein-like [Clytia hemisphaerica]|uniref:Cnidarian restricted protein n=1 Tax=Clytia hemisphaerica TaxID=252671 RepID=A0A7M5UTC9_9CNID|eukprot:TCONS_00031682-protein
MHFKILLVAFLVAFAAASKHDEKIDRDAIREMRKLDQDLLYDALKHKSLRDHVELDEDDHEFLAKVSKDELKKLLQEFSEDEDELNDEEEMKAFKKESQSDDPSENEDQYENTESHAENALSSDEMTDDEMELSRDEDIDNFDTPRMSNDPWGRRRRRRRRSRFLSNIKKIRDFLKKHGETIKAGIKWLRKIIYHCCNVTRKCSGRWWCAFGKA